MELPRVNAVGVVEHPDGYEVTPRGYPAWLRTVAVAVLATFVLVVLVTSAVTLGAYCLTSDGGDGRLLREPATSQGTAVP